MAIVMETVTWVVQRYLGSNGHGRQESLLAARVSRSRLRFPHVVRNRHPLGARVSGEASQLDPGERDRRLQRDPVLIVDPHLEHVGAAADEEDVAGQLTAAEVERRRE